MRSFFRMRCRPVFWVPIAAFVLAGVMVLSAFVDRSRPRAGYVSPRTKFDDTNYYLWLDGEWRFVTLFPHDEPDGTQVHRPERLADNPPWRWHPIKVVEGHRVRNGNYIVKILLSDGPSVPVPMVWEPDLYNFFLKQGDSDEEVPN